MARLTQRADEIQQCVALVQRIELHGRVADFLEDDGDSALLAVVTGNGQRDAFAFLINAEDDELPWQRLARHQRRFDFHERDRFIQHTLFDNGKHIVPSSLL